MVGTAQGRLLLTLRMLSASLRANGSRECAPDDRLREAIHAKPEKEWIASSQVLLAMTENTASRSRRMIRARFDLEFHAF